MSAATSKEGESAVGTAALHMTEPTRTNLLDKSQVCHARIAPLELKCYNHSSWESLSDGIEGCDEGNQYKSRY